LQEGFLFGTVEEKHIEIISDSSESSVEPETIIRKNFQLLLPIYKTLHISYWAFNVF
jgi:hypothetical protein